MALPVREEREGGWEEGEGRGGERERFTTHLKGFGGMNGMWSGKTTCSTVGRGTLIVMM